MKVFFLLGVVDYVLGMESENGIGWFFIFFLIKKEWFNEFRFGVYIGFFVNINLLYLKENFVCRVDIENLFLEMIFYKYSFCRSLLYY